MILGENTSMTILILNVNLKLMNFCDLKDELNEFFYVEIYKLTCI